MRRWWERFVELVADFGAETGCAACGAERSCEDVFCRACRAQLELVAPAVLGGVPVLAGARYAPPVSLAVQRFKYGGRPDLARPLAHWLGPSLGPLGLGPGDLLVPVPLHPRRLAERRYNQAGLLCSALARRSGARALPLGLRRTRATPPQAQRNRGERAGNVSGAFAVRQPDHVRGQRVVLVDDVVTTGATAEACLTVLEHAGARVLAVVALARSTGRAA
jgi:ComF family protein